MNHIQNLLRVAIIAILAIFAFGPSEMGYAVQERIYQCFYTDFYQGT